MFKLDRTTFAKGKSSDAKNELSFWLSKSYTERISAAWYLTCTAYNINYTSQVKLDRNAFTCIKR